MKITVAHSPDSDDAFMFYGLASGAIDTGDLEVTQVLADIESLNQAALEGRYEVTAVSFHAYAYLGDRYALLPHGASMGDGYGPMVVTRAEAASRLDDLEVAIPGMRTSAWLVLQMYQPGLRHRVLPFDQILEAVRDGKVDAGLLIHEGQLTYEEAGLRQLIDLGAWWREKTAGLPLPLGCNVIRRDLGPDNMLRVSKLLRDSIAYALDHRTEAIAYAEQFGRGLDRERTDTFVGMYVNDLTLDYGERGRAAVQRFFDEAWALRLIPRPVETAFAE
ncbi:MAG: ABC transporter substrate-binding protein [Luteitalea sp.]|nr:ABC transporter substrate-binding protein [Luteitalea sp.]